MKKFVSIMLALVLTLTGIVFLSACESEEVVLRVLENDNARKSGYLQYLLDEFNKKYADEGIKAVDANQDEFSDLEENGPYGYGPDVLYQAHDAIMKYLRGKHVYPLNVTEMEGYDKISEASWNAFSATVDGRKVILGVPINVQQPLLFYRKDILPANWQTNWDADKDNIPDMVQYWTEMYRYSKEVREADSKKFGFALSLNNEYFTSGFIFTYGGYVFGSNNTDDKDIGYNKGESVKGAQVIHQLAGIMDLQCRDDSFTKKRDSMMAEGSIFATITTPDTYADFIKSLTATYVKGGMTVEAANAKAVENIVVTDLPFLPKSGDITQPLDIADESLWLQNKVMGGINGYAMSSYSENKDLAWKFIQFASSKEMVAKRNEFLGIVPARSDVPDTVGGLSGFVLKNLDDGVNVLMPSISSVGSIWTPISTGLKNIATNGSSTVQEAFTPYTTEDLQRILDKISKDIYDAIHILAGGK